ncbi:MAG: hypothetical protein QOD75_3418 [Blastocatellia bacterium]|nr:hypothetical protein [Blastocatellia bacterium]
MTDRNYAEMITARRFSIRISFWFFAGAVFLAVAPLSFAQGYPQDPRAIQMPAPPPLRFMTRFEREQLTTAKDAKDRIRLSIELAEGHLLRGEEFSTALKHDSCLIEIGSYMALVDDAMNFLGSMKRDANRTRDLYKRLELALRAHGLRLAGIRRVTPAEYAGQVKAAEEFTRNVRTDALDSFYGHTVLRELPQEAKEGPRDPPTKESPVVGGPKRP